MQVIRVLLLGLVGLATCVFAEQSKFSVDGIKPGMSKAQVSELKGSPVRVLVSDFGPTWIFPNPKSNRLTMVQFTNGIVRGVSGSNFAVLNKQWNLESSFAEFSRQRPKPVVRSVPLRGETDGLDFNEFVIDGSKVAVVTRGKDRRIQYFNLEFKEP